MKDLFAKCSRSTCSSLQWGHLLQAFNGCSLAALGVIREANAELSVDSVPFWWWRTRAWCMNNAVGVFRTDQAQMLWVQRVVDVARATTAAAEADTRQKTKVARPPGRAPKFQPKR